MGANAFGESSQVRNLKVNRAADLGSTSGTLHDACFFCHIRYKIEYDFCHLNILNEAPVLITNFYGREDKGGLRNCDAGLGGLRVLTKK